MQKQNVILDTALNTLDDSNDNAIICLMLNNRPRGQVGGG